MLSIGRLCYLATYQKGKAGPDEPIGVAFVNGLDFIAVQQELLEKFRAIQAGIRGKRSMESELDVIVDTTASGLIQRPRLLRVGVLTSFTYRTVAHVLL